MSCITAAISQIFALCLINQSTINIINYCSEEHVIKTLQLLYLELCFFPQRIKQGIQRYSWDFEAMGLLKVSTNANEHQILSV